MRIIKLSQKDPDMKNKDAVKLFFQAKLFERNPQGKFLLTKGRISKNGLESGELLIFSYKSAIVYLGLVKNGRQQNKGMDSYDYPFYFCVDVNSIVPGKGYLKNLEYELDQIGLLEKNIEKSQGWPIVSESPETKNKIKKVWNKFVK
jgi:hypothetical protein